MSIAPTSLICIYDYFPVNTGGRFSKKAAMPSLKSSAFPDFELAFVFEGKLSGKVV